MFVEKHILWKYILFPPCLVDYLEIIAYKTWLCILSKICCACANTCLPVPVFYNHFRSLLSFAKHRFMICKDVLSA